MATMRPNLPDDLDLGRRLELIESRLAGLALDLGRKKRILAASLVLDVLCGVLLIWVGSQLGSVLAELDQAHRDRLELKEKLTDSQVQDARIIQGNGQILQELRDRIFPWLDRHALGPLPDHDTDEDTPDQSEAHGHADARPETGLSRADRPTGRRPAADHHGELAPGRPPGVPAGRGQPAVQRDS
jgi:hypothetical protein